MGRLVASVAHQIRNPLAAISQAAELPDDPGEGVEHARLEGSNRAAANMSTTTCGDWSRWSPTCRCSPCGERLCVQLAQVLPEVVERWRARRCADPVVTAIANLGVAAGLDARCCSTRRCSRWSATCSNNALRYCRRVPGSIWRRPCWTIPMPTLVIWNDGPGAAEQQRSLFEPFFTDAQNGEGLYAARCAAQRRADPLRRHALDTFDRTGALTMEARDTLPAPRLRHH